MGLDGLAAAEDRRASSAAGLEPPPATLTTTELAFAARLTQRGRHASPKRRLRPRRPFLEADLVAAGATVRGIWIRQRGVSRERRSAGSSRARATRAGPRRSSDDPHPLARVRGFAAASTRMVVHLVRRRAAMRAA